MKKALDTKRNILIGVAIFLVLLLILLLWNPFSNSKEDNSINAINEQDSLVNNQQDEQTTEPEIENKEIIYSDSDLCEDYVVEQGETIDVDGFKLKLLKIAKNSARIEVDGKQAIISEGDSLNVNDLHVELYENDLIYFAEDDADNSVEFRVGCKTNELPSEKHILKTLTVRGDKICTALIETCKEEFGTE